MSAKVTVTEVMRLLRSSRANCRCEKLKELLHRLGFEVRDGKRAGHKLVLHGGIPGFMSASFDCGHGKNPEIKPAYIRNMLRIVERYEAEIIEYLEEN